MAGGVGIRTGVVPFAPLDDAPLLLDSPGPAMAPFSDGLSSDGVVPFWLRPSRRSRSDGAMLFLPDAEDAAQARSCSTLLAIARWIVRRACELPRERAVALRKARALVILR